MKIELYQTWLSESHPHESFVIYDGINVETGIDHGTNDFNELPEKAKIYCWKRYDKFAFDDFIKSKKGEDYDSTYPYAWAGECKKQGIVNKIKKFNMQIATK